MPHPGLWDAQHAVYQHHHRPNLPNLHQTFCSIKWLNANNKLAAAKHLQKKATTKPDNLLCPSTKVQLGKQEWLALANVGKTTCKISQHKMDPKHHTKPLLYMQKWSQILAWRFQAKRKKQKPEFSLPGHAPKVQHQTNWNEWRCEHTGQFQDLPGDVFSTSWKLYAIIAFTMTETTTTKKYMKSTSVAVARRKRATAALSPSGMKSSASEDAARFNIYNAAAASIWNHQHILWSG